ncbi:hypothetical protein MJD09_09165 [bacterium]|nr:hypothetical protein [bacterium]
MFGSEILEVGMGISLVYLLLALLCSVLNEWATAVLSLRSRTLEKGIRNLLAEDEDGTIAQKFYAHPLIKDLAGKRDKPSYIPSKAFARVVLNLIAPADAKNSLKLADIRSKVDSLPNNELKQKLLVLLDDAGGEIEKARENIEEWFDDTMDRVSGWFKRKAQLIILVFALIVTCLANADTIAIAKFLWRNDAQRAVLVAYAEGAAKEPSDPGRSFEGLRAEIASLDLPIGWSLKNGKATGGQAGTDLSQVPTSFEGWVTKVIGLIITTLAVSLGSPFWFDLLNKLVSLRSTGNKPKSSSGSA